MSDLVDLSKTGDNLPGNAAGDPADTGDAGAVPDDSTAPDPGAVDDEVTPEAEAEAEELDEIPAVGEGFEGFCRACGAAGGSIVIRKVPLPDPDPDPPALETNQHRGDEHGPAPAADAAPDQEV